MTWDISINRKHCEFVRAKGCFGNDRLVEFCTNIDNLYGPCREADCPIKDIGCSLYVDYRKSCKELKDRDAELKKSRG